jgi:hypothetical protein
MSPTRFHIVHFLVLSVAIFIVGCCPKMPAITERPHPPCPPDTVVLKAVDVRNIVMKLSWSDKSKCTTHPVTIFAKTCCSDSPPGGKGSLEALLNNFGPITIVTAASDSAGMQ